MMLGLKEVEEVRKVPSSSEIIKKGIEDMYIDLLETLIDEVKSSGKFFFGLMKKRTSTKKHNC